MDRVMEAKKKIKRVTATTKGDKSKSAQALDNLKNVEFMCNYGWNESKYSESFKLRMAEEFYRWAYHLAFEEANPRPYSYTYWCSKSGVRRTVIEKWRAKCPKIDALFRSGIEMLGHVREMGMLEKKFPEKPIMYSQFLYSDEWKEADAYHDKRKERTVDSITSLIGAVIENVDLDDSEREEVVEVSEEERQREIESKVDTLKKINRHKKKNKANSNL